MGSLGGGNPFKNKPVNIIVKKPEINRLIHGKFMFRESELMTNCKLCIANTVRTTKQED
jgi:hypothetical protein